MRIIVVGARGGLGTEVVKALTAVHKVVAAGREELDLADDRSLRRLALGELGAFDWVVNCAAYTAVDRAETEPRAALRINAHGPMHLALGAAALGARLLHVSTDFVFDGEKGAPYEETDPPNPLGIYGATKWMGEEEVLGAASNHLVVRTSWLYGPSGPCFPATIRKAHVAGRALRVVADQTGTPTFTPDLAAAIRGLVEIGPPGGIYHAAGPETMSWADLAERALGEPVARITTEEWLTPARRPRASSLATPRLDALGLTPFGDAGPAWLAARP